MSHTLHTINIVFLINFRLVVNISQKEIKVLLLRLPTSQDADVCLCDALHIVSVLIIEMVLRTNNEYLS